MSTHRNKTHPLTVLHIVAMVGLLVWWSFYFWHHSPAREMLQARQTAADVARAPVGDRPQMPRARKGSADSDHRRTAVPTLGRAAADSLGKATERAGAAVNAALADVAGGLFVLILFGVATGVYVRRFEIWLQARSSGDAMTLAGTGLSDKALAANADRGGVDRGRGAR